MEILLIPSVGYRGEIWVAGRSFKCKNNVSEGGWTVRASINLFARGEIALPNFCRDAMAQPSNPDQGSICT